MKKLSGTIPALNHLRSHLTKNRCQLLSRSLKTMELFWVKISMYLAAITCMTVICIIIVFVGNVVYATGNHAPPGLSGSLSHKRQFNGSAAFGMLPEADTHTAAWYVTHPAILKQYEKLCAKAAATMS
ncbi:MAG TPA: hypothetical protein PLT25_06005, partial [Acidocella sp.]|nr:hypothetical protein [Acidocella sp.]